MPTPAPSGEPALHDADGRTARTVLVRPSLPAETPGQTDAPMHGRGSDRGRSSDSGHDGSHRHLLRVASRPEDQCH